MEFYFTRKQVFQMYTCWSWSHSLCRWSICVLCL